MLENKRFREQKVQFLNAQQNNSKEEVMMDKENYKKITKEESWRIAEMIWEKWIESEFEMWFFGYVGVSKYCIRFFLESPLPARDAKGNKLWSVPGNDGEIQRPKLKGENAKDLIKGEMIWELAEKIEAGYGRIEE